MPPRQVRRYLPHGFEEKRTPDGRSYWINYYPLPPSWLPPADVAADFPNLYMENDNESAADVKTPVTAKDIKLPKGVQRHYTPSGSVYYVDARPRASWTDPRTVDFNIDKERDAYAKTCEILFSDGEFLGTFSPPVLHNHRRNGAPVCHSLTSISTTVLTLTSSGFECNYTVNIETELYPIGSVQNIHQLKPMDSAFLYFAAPPTHWVFFTASEAELASYGPSKAARLEPPSPSIIWRLFQIVTYCILLGVPTTYARRLQKADWVQRALDGFLKSLTTEWNLINLTAALLLSAAVGMLTVNDLSTTSQTAILIALVTALASLIMSVTFVWRYQRQLSNIHDLRKIMDEFIYEADADIMPIFLSLPVSFLLWSAIAFGTAVLTHAWHTLGSSGPAISIGVTATLGMTIVVTGVIWLSHRQFERWKAWWDITAWAKRKGDMEEHEVGLMHV
ncbi:hypothetical protein FRC10_006569 [Ceratobasidium sp. 414]|nr:hypothetical protein FRC10_006569 [Ceratobasidium sp. 414]